MKTTEINDVAPGFSVEEIKAMFFDGSALREPDYRLYQFNSDGHRYYYRFDEEGTPEFFPSVTTLLKQVMPTSPALIDWMISNGKEGAAEKRDLAASYGTFMHIQFESLLINRRFDFDAVAAVLLDYIKQRGIPGKMFSEWLPKIRKDVLAFAQFVRDYEVQPLAIEIGLVHPSHRYAGCIDLPCMLTDKKTGERFPAIVDFKSGRKGFYEEHELQLALYRHMWNVNFPDVPVERIFNFAPKDWRVKPTYTLKEQTESPNVGKLPHLLALAAIEDAKRDNTLTVVRGVLDLDKGDLTDNILSVSFADLVKGTAREDEGARPEPPKAPVVLEESPKPKKRARKAPEKPAAKKPDIALDNLLNDEIEL